MKPFMMSEKEKNFMLKYTSNPATDVSELIYEKKKVSSGPICIAEIGVGIGATMMKNIKYLEKSDSYYLFDYSDIVDNAVDNCTDLDLANGITFIRCGCERGKIFSSYDWPLAKLLHGKYQRKESPEMFDVVYLDAARSYLLDGLAVCLIKTLLKTNGYIILNGYGWPYQVSFSQIPDQQRQQHLESSYTEEQLNMCQVQFVAELFLDPDPAFKRVDGPVCTSATTLKRIFYQKISM